MGVLFGFNGFDGSLYQVDLTTGGASFVGNSGVVSNGPGLVFDSARGKLLAYQGFFGNIGGAFHEIDPLDATATFVSEIEDRLFTHTYDSLSQSGISLGVDPSDERLLFSVDAVSGAVAELASLEDEITDVMVRGGYVLGSVVYDPFTDNLVAVQSVFIGPGSELYRIRSIDKNSGRDLGIVGGTGSVNRSLGALVFVPTSIPEPSAFLPLTVFASYVLRRRRR